MKAIKVIILLIISLLLQSKVTAQFSINGTITDPSSVPINSAFVEIIDEDDTTNYYSTYTNESGSFIISNITDVHKSSNKVPNNFLVLSNYPNPFNPSTIIYYELPRAENIEIKIYDIIGREVRTLLSKFQEAGIFNVSWDGRSNFNQPVAAGIYLCRLKTKDQSRVHKMVLLDGGSNFSSVGNQILKKVEYSNIQRTISKFNFSIRVTADSVLESEYNNLTCSGDTTLNLVVSKILKTENIGTEGGTIETEDISISIPSGALNEGHDISIAKAEDDEAFGENTVSQSYQIYGLPKEFTKPIKVKVKYTGILDGESYLAEGKKVFDYDYNRTVAVYKLNTAIDSSGYLVSELSSRVGDGLEKVTSNLEGEDELDIVIKFLSRYATLDSQHFIIKYPLLYVQFVTKVLEIYEDAYYLIYEGLEMPLLDVDRNITIKKLAKPTFAYQDDFSHEFLINQEELANQIYYNIQTGAVQDFFRLITYPNYRWFNNSIYSWLEDLVSDDPNYKYPEGFIDNTIAPFKGIYFHEDNISIEKHLAYGSGMSAVIKYLIEHTDLGYGGIGNIYKNGWDLRENLINAVSLSASIWWPTFFRYYITNQIYDIPIQKFLDNANEKWEISSVEEPEKVFSSSQWQIGSYKKLSAKMFEINFNPDNYDNQHSMLFSLDTQTGFNDLSILLFNIVDDKAQYLGMSKNTGYELKFKEYLASGEKKLLVVLVNSDYSIEKRDIDLRVKITNLPEYSMCSVTMNFPVETRTYNSDTGEEEFGTRLFPNLYPRAVGSFNGNTWTGSFDEDEWNGQLVVTLNDNFDMVTSMDFSYTITTDNSSGTFGYTFTDIPRSKYYWETSLYSLAYEDDTTLCDHVSNIVYNYTWGSISTTLNGNPVCDENSWVNIRFYP